jgi:hypothetical protein
MKLALSFLAMLATSLCASHLGLTSVKQPVYLIGTDSDSVIRIVDVPYVTRWADPEWRFTAICRPFVPATDGSWTGPHDVNLASLYGITVAGTYKKDSPDVEVVIDASKAVVPPRYPFSLDQVVDAVTTCVKLMYPPKPEEEGKLVIKVIPRKSPAQQDGAGQPATRPESKSEGGDKPQPKPEGRSR